MLILRLYEQWHDIYLLGDHFRPIVRKRKLCVIVLVYLGSAFVGLFHRVLMCVRQLLVFGRKRDCFQWGYWCPCWGHWPRCGYTAGRHCLTIFPCYWLLPGTLWPDRVPWQTLTKWRAWPSICVRIPVSICQSKLCLAWGVSLSCKRCFFLLKFYPDQVN